MRSLALVLVLAATASAGDAPIINGTYDANDPAVVEIYAYPQNKSTLYTCTGSLISPHHVLAAAHCFDHEATYIYGVYFGPDANQYMGQIALIESHLKFAKRVDIHPDYQTTSPYLADIGILTFKDPVPDVTPLAFSRTAPDASMIGAAVRIVGYGQRMPNVFQNDKYAADTVIAGLDNGADTILVGDTSRSCQGDSGGPVLLDNVILGVDSYSAAGCDDPAHYRRTDYYQDFIDSIVSPGAGSGSGSNAGSNAGSDNGSAGSDAGSGSATTPPADSCANDNDCGGGGCNSGHGAGLLVALSVLLVRRRR